MGKILIVDDEKGIRITLGEFLSVAGHSVSLAADADETLAALRSARYDVVVSDIVMPRMSGVELLKTIREVDERVQVILMTGDPNVETAADALRADASDYLTKPVHRNAILRSVGNALRIKALDDERRRLLEVYRKHQVNLAALVHERTSELEESNERLTAALEALRNAQQQVVRQERLNALGQMASGIAHDFNNVLMPILGLSNLLLSRPELLENREETLTFLECIHSAAGDAREIVRRLREFYRPDEDLEVTPTNLTALVSQAITLTEPAWRAQCEAEGRGIHLVSNVAELSVVLANETQIREVLTNLILNSVDAMVDGGTITLTATQENDRVKLSVSDMGTGMADDVLAKCREPFFTTKGEHGTGLGLAMCHGIVQRHGGSLEITSTVGKGTTVCMSLPVVQATEQEKASSLDRSPAAVNVPPSRILVIDDEDTTCLLLSRYLTSQGHTVDWVTSGEEGLQKLADASYDLVFTDRAMPGMGGDEVARRIAESAPGTPVVLLTGFGDLMNLQNERPKGVSVVASKPITSEELAKIVSRILAGVAIRTAADDGR